jgi:Carboxypeptidase regulatory-like domain
LFVVGMCVVVLGCGGHLPGAPGDIMPLTISGYVYEQEVAGSGEPMLAEVLITVQETDGSPRSAKSDGVGFYTVPVRAGTISITASKVGYGTRASSFYMSKSTVLSFSLTPQ